MTAEAAVFNAEAIALAADSAVTLTLESGQKIFTSANKIFALSKYRPVGIMVYGNANLMGVPWETVIKRYRAELKKRSFSHLEDYANHFKKYIAENTSLHVKEFADSQVLQNIRTQYAPLRDAIFHKLEASLNAEKELSTDRIRDVTSQTTLEYVEVVRKNFTLPENEATYDLNAFLEDYGKLVDLARDQIFQKLPFSAEALRALQELARLACLGLPLDESSGFVIAGYGEDDLFPALHSYRVIWLSGGLGFIDEHSMSVPKDTDSAVVPFAQQDVVATFMEGVAPDYQAAIEKDFADLIEELPKLVLSAANVPDEQRNGVLTSIGSVKDKLVEHYQKRLAAYRRRNYVRPVTATVRWLPKEELAAMAESLVNLTSFRRRVTNVPETVGGPIDVAVISRGDGFVWIKRKHYFKAELNPQFLHNYYLDTEEGDENGRSQSKETEAE